MKPHRVFAFFLIIGIFIFTACKPQPEFSEPSDILEHQLSQSQTPSEPEEESNPSQLISEDSVQSNTGLPDVIFFNASILTMNIDQPTAQAVAIDGGTIYAVGDDQEILSLAGAETQRIDLEGKILFPGFIDSHGHRITQRGKWGFSTVLEAAQEALSLGWTSLTELAVDQGQLQEMIDAQKSG